MTTSSPRALLINTAFLGDVVFTLPAVAALGEAGYQVDVLTRPGYGLLARGLPGFRAAIDYDKRGTMAGAAALRALGQRLRAEAYDVVVGAHPSLRSGLLAWQTRAPVRVGWGPVGYTHRVRRGPRFVEDALQLLETIGVSAGAAEPRLARADLTRGEQPPPGAIALIPGARWGTKRWPLASWQALAASLRAEGRPVWAIGGPEDAELCLAIGADRALTEAPLAPLVNTLAGFAAVVGGDTGLVHLAAAAGLPALLLFGPTAAGRHPMRPHFVPLSVPNLACRPCSAHGPAWCPLGHHRCMTDLSPSVVRDGLHGLLDTPG